MTNQEFVEKALKKFTLNITDALFLYIQHDEELRKEYFKLADFDNKKAGTLNQALGRAIKEDFNLDNLDEDKNPLSCLIKSFTKHRK